MYQILTLLTFGFIELSPRACILNNEYTSQLKAYKLYYSILFEHTKYREINQSKTKAAATFPLNNQLFKILIKWETP